MSKKFKKDLAKAHIKLKELVDDKNALKRLFGVGSISAGLVLGVIFAAIAAFNPVISIVCGALWAFTGVTGAVLVSEAMENEKFDLYKNEMPELTIEQYKENVKTGKVNDYIMELNKSEIVNSENEIIPSEIERVTEVPSTDARNDYDKMIKRLYRKLRAGKELNAKETDLINRSIEAEAYAREMTTNNKTFADEQNRLRRSAMKKNGKFLTPEERAAVNNLK